MPAKSIYNLLKERRILTIPRMGYTGKDLVWVTPHFFNTKEEIDTFAEVLQSLM